MININPGYEVIFDPGNIDQNCDRIAGLMSDEGNFIKEALDAGLYKQGVAFIATNHRRPSKYYAEERLLWHWLRRNIKL